MLLEEKLLFSVDDVPVPALIYSRQDGRLVDWNNAARQFLEFAETDEPSVNQWRKEAKLTTGDSDREWNDLGVIPHITKRGEERLARVLERKIVHQGEACSINWITDVHDQIQSEIINKNFHRAVTSASIVSMADKSGRITYVNENFERISGYQRGELVGKNHRVINSGHHPKEFWASMWHTISLGRAWRAEVKNRAKDGTFYWVDTFIMPFLDERGKIKEFLSIRNDITLRKQAQEELEKANESLSETLIFGRMGSAYLDLRTFQLTVSSELFKLLDEPERNAQTVSLESFLLKYVKSEYLELIYDKVKQGLSGAFPDRNEVTVEFEMITSQGRTIWIEAEGIFKLNTGLGILRDITLRKSTEQKILKEREHLNNIINSLPGVFYLFDAQGKFLKWNKNFESVSGYSAKEIGQMVPFDFFREEEKVLIAERIGKVFAEGTADVEANFLTKEGVVIPYYFNGWAGTFEGQHCLIGMGLDLTALRKAEGEAQSRLALIESMMNGITDGIFAMDRELNFTLVNPAFASMANMRQSEMTGRNVKDIFPSIKGTRLLETYETAVRTQRPMSFEHKSIIVDKSDKIFLVNIYPNPEGLFVYFKDISNSKKAEQQLIDTNELFGRLSGNVPGMIYNFSADNDRGGFPFVSDGSKLLLGISPEELQENPGLFFDMIHPEDISSVLTSIREARQSLESWDSEFRIVLKNGGVKWIATASKPYREQTGKYFWYGFMYDITIRKVLEIEREILRMTSVNEVTEKLKNQNELIATLREKEMLIREMHHRVKNNLQLISSILFIRLNKMKESETKDFLIEMRQRIRAIAFIHEKLLQTGSINQLGVAEFLKKIISDVQMTINTREKSIIIESEIEEVRMDSDSAIYCGLIMNELITNSIKHAFKGREEGRIEIHFRKEGAKFYFSVADNGIGIGLPLPMTNGVNASFGMQLIDTFGKQLKADVTVDNTCGTRFRFVFG